MSRLSGQLAVDLVDPTSGVSVHRRIGVGEVPLVGRELAIGVHVPLAQQQHDLPLGPFGVKSGQHDAMKRRVPGGEPGILPLVGHAQDVEVVDVPPVRVAATLALGRRLGTGRVAVEPELDAVVVELLGPEEPGIRLALDRRRSSSRPAGWIAR